MTKTRTRKKKRSRSSAEHDCGCKEKKEGTKKAFQVQEMIVEKAAHPTEVDDYGLPINSHRILRARITVLEARCKHEVKKIVLAPWYPRWGDWVSRDKPHNEKYRDRCRDLDRKIVEVK